MHCHVFIFLSDIQILLNYLNDIHNISVLNASSLYFSSFTECIYSCQHLNTEQLPIIELIIIIGIVMQLKFHLQDAMFQFFPLKG